MNVSICGIVGIPGNYGGFETFAEFLVKNTVEECNYTVFCDKNFKYDPILVPSNCQIKRLPLKANGYQSILYDALGMLISSYKGDTILLLGCSGGWLVPFLSVFNVNIITNIAGLEWSRSKWGIVASFLLRKFESFAIRYSKYVVADNQVLSNYIKEEYNIDAHTIAYGGDHLPRNHTPIEDLIHRFSLPYEYFISVGRCQPDNNIEQIIQAFIGKPLHLVSISNWDSCEYGANLKRKYSGYSNIHLLDPIYNLKDISALRLNSIGYIHGHSAGGTNPTLVEAMWLKVPVFSFDVSFNRETTNEQAFFWSSVSELELIVSSYYSDRINKVDEAYTFASKYYSWKFISDSYLSLFKGKVNG